MIYMQLIDFWLINSGKIVVRWKLKEFHAPAGFPQQDVHASKLALAQGQSEVSDGDEPMLECEAESYGMT